MQNKECKSICELQSQKMHLDLKIKSYLFRPFYFRNSTGTSVAQETGESLLQSLTSTSNSLSVPILTVTNSMLVLISYYLHESHESRWVPLQTVLISFKTTVAKPQDIV